MATTASPLLQSTPDAVAAEQRGETVHPGDDLEQQIAAFFAEQLSIDVPSPQTDLIDSGVLDSLKFVDLILHMEQKFGVRAASTDLDVDNFRSIQKIAAFVSRQRS